MWKRQGLEEHAVEDAEDGRRDPDPQREGEHRQQGHEPRANEGADTKLEILIQAEHATPPVPWTKRGAAPLAALRAEYRVGRNRVMFLTEDSCDERSGVCWGWRPHLRC